MLSSIRREPRKAAEHQYDLVVVGGGVHGVMLALEATRRGLRPLMIERGDFGGATSYNSLRIVHGGLRYLQGLDFRRFRQSVRERAWFMKCLPSLVRPLPCIMPIYGEGMRRRSVLWLAVLANSFLSLELGRDRGAAKRMPEGQLISGAEIREIFPAVDTRGLRGGLLWYDAFMPNAPRVIIELLRWACGAGAVALNYLEVKRLLKQGRKVCGVCAVDHLTGEIIEFRTRMVINATGPWCREVAIRLGAGDEHLPGVALAWNVLFDRAAPSDHALALTPGAGSHTYFLLPWRGRLLAGTGHAAWNGGADSPFPSEDELDSFVADLNAGVPGLDLDRKAVLLVFPGLLPAAGARSARPAARERIVNHGKEGGPEGLFSVWGTKFTTARSVAEKALAQAFPRAKARRGEFASPVPMRSRLREFDFDWLPNPQDAAWLEELRPLIADEAVEHLDDLIFRRTTLGDNPQRARELAPRVCELFNWDAQRCRNELARVAENLRRHELEMRG